MTLSVQNLESRFFDSEILGRPQQRLMTLSFQNLESRFFDSEILGRPQQRIGMDCAFEESQIIRR